MIIYVHKGEGHENTEQKGKMSRRLRRYWACNWTVRSAVRGGCKYFVTYTFGGNLEEADRIWRYYRDWLAKRGVWGVRVYECIPGEVRLHVHAVQSIITSEIMSKWWDMGGGRVHVVKIQGDGVAGYLAKYLTKGGEEGLPRHWRRWGCFGKWPPGVEKVRVCDVEEESELGWHVRWLMDHERMSPGKAFRVGMRWLIAGTRERANISGLLTVKGNDAVTTCTERKFETS